jgi:hypothetical protein
MPLTPALLMFFTLGRSPLRIGVTIGAAVSWLRKQWQRG